jgi:DNA-binding MarR family transcriptional regulator
MNTNGIIPNIRGSIAPAISLATSQGDPSQGATSDIVSIPLPTHPYGHAGKDPMDVPTRCWALAALLADPGVRQQIGSAWPLYLMLAMKKEGTMTGTRDDIAGQLGESTRNVCNWISGLEKAGIVNMEKHGRRMTISLTGKHMEAARLSEYAPVITPVVAEPIPDARQREILDLMAKATSLGGAAEIRITVKSQ